MKFRVVFPRTVVYNQGHIKGQRDVTELIVNAPDAQGALIHAYRVVTGDVGTPTVEPYTEMPAEIPVEAQTAGAP